MAAAEERRDWSVGATIELINRFNRPLRVFRAVRARSSMLLDAMGPSFWVELLRTHSTQSTTCPRRLKERLGSRLQLLPSHDTPRLQSSRPTELRLSSKSGSESLPDVALKEN